LRVALLALTLIVFFSACSTKKVYEPDDVAGEWENYGDSTEEIIDVTSDVALLDNHLVLSDEEVLEIEVPSSHRLIAKSDGWIISAEVNGSLLLQNIEDTSLTEQFELSKTIAAASIQGDTLAIMFADNELALYSITSKEPIFKEQGNRPYIVDARIVNPHFMNDLVLFFTLDGKVIIVSEKHKKKLRSIIISSEDKFNNVIDFAIVDNKIIAATGQKILSLAQKEIRVRYEIRNVVYDGNTIYITTKQGEVISLTPDLQVNAKAKFPFAHFLGAIASDEKLYLLEKEGYLIEMSKDLLEYEVYEAALEEGFVYVAKKKFFIADEYISVEE
jgi:hypothetical protein